jgi:hypothetical protein
MPAKPWYAPEKERYFMSTEQEKAANWDRIEEYKTAKKRLSNLRGELHTIGESYVQVGESLRQQLDNLDLPTIERMPFGKDISRAVSDFKKAMSEHNRLSAVIRDMGVEPF